RPSHDHRRSRADPAPSLHGDPHSDYPQCGDSRLLSPLGSRRPTEKGGARRGDAKVPHHPERDGPRSTSVAKCLTGITVAESPPCGRRTGFGGPTPPERSPTPGATAPIAGGAFVNNSSWRWPRGEARKKLPGLRSGGRESR